MFWKYEEDKIVERTLDQEDREVYMVLPRKEEKQKVIVPNWQEANTPDIFLSSDETGSEKRFDNRVSTFKKEDKPVYKHHFWWFIHNCVAHPLIGIIPCKRTFNFHDWTSIKINRK